MKVKFYLAKSKVNKDGTVPIRVHVNFHRETYKINLGRTIHPDHWDSKGGCAREGKKYPLGSLINQVLDKARSDFRAAELKLEVLGLPLTFENLIKHTWPDKVRVKPVNTDYLISEVIDKLGFVRSGRKDASMAKYDTLKFSLNEFKPELRISHVKNYGKVIGLADNLLENKGAVFAEKYTAFLQGKKHADSTIAKYLSNLREVYGEIGLDKDTRYLDYTSRTAEKVSLLAEELAVCVNNRLDNASAELHRKLFVVQTLMGLRDSDCKQLKSFLFYDLEVKGYGKVKVLEGLYMRKTSAKVLIPVHPKAVEILEELDYQLPTFTAAARTKGLRKFFKLLGLKRSVSETSFIGNSIVTEAKTLDELVTSHTARRTCGQLLRKQTGSKDIAQYMLGHKEQGSTSIYTTEDPDRVIPIILKAWDEILNPAKQADIN